MTSPLNKANRQAGPCDGPPPEVACGLPPMIHAPQTPADMTATEQEAG